MGELDLKILKVMVSGDLLLLPPGHQCPEQEESNSRLRKLE
jgi:hypothetical protein